MNNITQIQSIFSGFNFEQVNVPVRYKLRKERFLSDNACGAPAVSLTKDTKAVVVMIGTKSQNVVSCEGVYSDIKRIFVQIDGYLYPMSESNFNKVFKR